MGNTSLAAAEVSAREHAFFISPAYCYNQAKQHAMRSAKFDESPQPFAVWLPSRSGSQTKCGRVDDVQRILGSGLNCGGLIKTSVAKTGCAQRFSGHDHRQR